MLGVMLFIQLGILTRTEKIKAAGDCITSKIGPDSQSSLKHMNLITKHLLIHPFRILIKWNAVLSVPAITDFKDSYDLFLRHST